MTHQVGCGKDLGEAIICGERMALCHGCFMDAFGDWVVPVDWQHPLSAEERAVADELEKWVPYFRGLGHGHARLDANTRVALARIAVAALPKASAERPRIRARRIR